MNHIKINTTSRLELNKECKIILPKNAFCLCELYESSNYPTHFMLEVRGILSIDKNDMSNQLNVSVMVVETSNTEVDYTDWFVLINKIRDDLNFQYIVLINRDK